VIQSLIDTCMDLRQLIVDAWSYRAEFKKLLKR